MVIHNLWLGKVSWQFLTFMSLLPDGNFDWYLDCFFQFQCNLFSAIPFTGRWWKMQLLFRFRCLGTNNISNRFHLLPAFSRHLLFVFLLSMVIWRYYLHQHFCYCKIVFLLYLGCIKLFSYLLCSKIELLALLIPISGQLTQGDFFPAVQTFSSWLILHLFLLRT